MTQQRKPLFSFRRNKTTDNGVNVSTSHMGIPTSRVGIPTSRVGMSIGHTGLIAARTQYVLYALIALIVLLFGLVFLVGFDTPYDENPDYNAPLFTGVLISFTLFLLLATTVVAIASGVRSMYKYRSKHQKENGIRSARIIMAVATGTMCVLLLSFILAPVDAIKVNGALFADGFWLRVAEMFVDTSLFLLLAAFAAVGIGYTIRVKRHNEKMKRRNQVC